MAAANPPDEKKTGGENPRRGIAWFIGQKHIERGDTKAKPALMP